MERVKIFYSDGFLTPSKIIKMDYWMEFAIISLTEFNLN